MDREKERQEQAALDKSFTRRYKRSLLRGFMFGYIVYATATNPMQRGFATAEITLSVFVLRNMGFKRFAALRTHARRIMRSESGTKKLRR